MIGFYDPMGLADLDLWGQGEEASIGESLRLQPLLPEPERSRSSFPVPLAPSFPR